MEITKIWKEFNEYQDICQKNHDIELREYIESEEFKVIQSQHPSLSDLSGYEAKNLIREHKHGIVKRTLENALTWFNNERNTKSI